MGMYEGWFPQTDAHEINLDWILARFNTNMEIVTKINKAYETGELAGKNFAILGFFPTVDALQAAVPSPSAGDAYGIGASAPYDVYMYIDNAWSNVGPTGADGKAATITVGATTTLSSDRSAYVQNTGTQNAAILSFGIPRGVDGVDGVGVPAGGATGQVLAKTDDTDYNTSWSDIVTIAKQSIIDAIYPVGSIYMSVIATSPATLLGGTWEQITDRFLLAAGSTYTAGTSGGAASVTLEQDNLPAHQALIPGESITNNPEWSEPNQAVVYRYMAGTPSGAVPVSTGGSGKAIDIMPPYLAVYVWKRIA